MSKPTNGKRALRTTRWLPSPSSTLNKLERSGPWWRKLSKHSTTPERACGSFGHWWQSITYQISPTSPSLLNLPPPWLCIQLAANEDSLLRTSSSPLTGTGCHQNIKSNFSRSAWGPKGQNSLLKRHWPNGKRSSREGCSLWSTSNHDICSRLCFTVTQFIWFSWCSDKILVTIHLLKSFVKISTFIEMLFWYYRR